MLEIIKRIHNVKVGSFIMTWITNNRSHINISYPTQWHDYHPQQKVPNLEKSGNSAIDGECINEWWIHIDLFSCQSSPPIDQIEFPCCFGCYLPFSSYYHWCQQIAFPAKRKCIIASSTSWTIYWRKQRKRKKRKKKNFFHSKNHLLIEVHSVHWCCWSGATSSVHPFS